MQDCPNSAWCEELGKPVPQLEKVWSNVTEKGERRPHQDKEEEGEEKKGRRH